MRKANLFVAMLALVMLICLTAYGSAVVENPALQREVDSLIAQMKIPEARQSLRLAAAEGLKDPELLSMQAWLESHVYQEHMASLEIVKQAIMLEPNSLKHRLLMGGILLKAGEHGEGIAILHDALSGSVHINADDELLGEGHHLLAKHYLANGNKEQALLHLEEAIEYNQFNSEASLMLHYLYVMDRNYHKAYRLWREKNFISNEDKPFLPSLQGKSERYLELVEARSLEPFSWARFYLKLGFLNEAKLEYERGLELVTDSQAASELDQLEVFISFREAFKQYLDEYYRARVVDGIRAEYTFYEGLRPIYQQLAGIFSELDGKPFSRDWINQVNQEVAKTFGYNITFISANRRYLGTHFGHIADDYQVAVTQLGEKANLRLIVLHNMVSNGLLYWLTEGDSGVGGWNSNATEIVCVLGGTHGIAALFQYLDPQQMQGFLDSARAYDGQLDLTDPTAIFYSMELFHLLMETQLQAEVAEANRLGLTEVTELERFLVNQFLSHYLNTTILAHEGRHAIDNASGFTERWFGEGEYRAKLGELAYGTMQHFTLAQLYTPTIGSSARSDSHVSGNSQVFTDLVSYILENKEEYPQIDETSSILRQLVKLSEEEISDIAEELLRSNIRGF